MKSRKVKKLVSLKKKRNEIIKNDSYYQRVQCMKAFIALSFEHHIRSTLNVCPEEAICFYRSLSGKQIKKSFEIINGFLEFRQNAALKFRLFKDNGNYHCETSFIQKDSGEWKALDLDNYSGGNNGFYVIFEVNDMTEGLFIEERALNNAISQQKEDHELQP